MEGPLMRDPDPPACPSGGYCNNLWDYEVFELFFANDKQQYLEVEVGPHGHWLVLLFNGIRKPVSLGTNLNVNMIQNVAQGSTWRVGFEIPVVYFPPKVATFNAYAIHGSDPNRHYEALYPVTDGSFDQPDFHRLQFFQKIDIDTIIPERLNEVAVKDEFCGDLWGGVNRGIYLDL